MVKRSVNKFRITMVLLIVLVLGRVSYAFFSSLGSSEEQNVTTASMTIDISPKEAAIIGNDLIPINRNEINLKGAKKTFTVTSKNSKTMYVSIKLDITEMSEALVSNDFMWALYEGTDDTGSKIDEGNFSSATLENNFILKDGIEYAVSNTELDTEYTLYIWIQETNLDQNAMQNKSFSAKIIAEGVFEQN